MEHGVRNELLDFSKVIPHGAGIYRRAQSGKTPREINALRKQFAQKTAVKLSPSSFQFTPPRYDDEFEAAIEKLDAGEV
jgi:hypothetical protein